MDDPLSFEYKEIKQENTYEGIKVEEQTIEEIDINSENCFINEVYIKEENTSDGCDVYEIKHISEQAIMDIMPTEGTVKKLQQLNFSELPMEEKMKIKMDGRPTPIIQITQTGISHSKIYIRSFNPELYSKKSWLCGCEVDNALFCFPCLLFGGDLLWTKHGFNNLSKMKEKTEKHDGSKEHMDNVISLSLLGNVNINDRISEEYRLSIIEHNNKVAKNRKILLRIIGCIKFCDGYDEAKDLKDQNVYRGLLNCSSISDPDASIRFESNIVFKEVSDTIQHDILDCLLQICQNEILTEIKEAPFIAAMVNVTIDVSETIQMVIVLRYELNGEIFERFWGVFNPKNHTADGLSECILNQLNIILQENTHKLIAQTFDGSNLMEGIMGEVQVKIKEIYCNAHFVHCYFHQSSLITKRAASITHNSRIFYSSLIAIPNFFSSSPQRLLVLKKHMNIPVFCSLSTKWDFDILTVCHVYENFESVKKAVQEIQTTFNADDNILEATLILYILNDKNFVFWLELFNQIMPHVDVICNHMDSQHIDAAKVQEYFANFKNIISELRNSKYCDNLSKTLTNEAKEVCDYFCMDIKERYTFTKHLVASKLFDKEKFISFRKNCPCEIVKETVKTFPVIEEAKLLTELQIFYGRPEMHNYGNLLNLLKFIMENKLIKVFSELTNLLRILLTIPMSTSEPEPCFSSLTKIKSFLQSSTNQKQLNAVAVISMENRLMNTIPNLSEKVINLLTQKNGRRMDFTLK